jgi:hypothetical protein
VSTRERRTPIRFGALLAIIGALTFLCSSSFASIDPRYHTYPQVHHILDSLSAAYPLITRLESLGKTGTDSLDIWALKISDNPGADENEPALLFNGDIHAEELLGTEVCLFFIEDMLGTYGTDSTKTAWIDECEIWVVPVINPEGHQLIWQGYETWRKNKRDNNGNGHFDADSDGVDLNRNFDFNWAGGGSTDPTSENYRGVAAFSEPEARAIRDLCLRESFQFIVNYHSPRTGQGEIIYYPWMWNGSPSPDFSLIREVADSVASRIPNDGGTGTYLALYGDAASGGMAHFWQYAAAGGLAYEIEVSDTTFALGPLVDDICARNANGLHYLLDRVHGGGIVGTVTDAGSDLPLQAEVRVLECFGPEVSPRVSDAEHGRFRRLLQPGLYTVQFIRAGYETLTCPSVPVVQDSLTRLSAELVALPGVGREGGGSCDPPGRVLLRLVPNPAHKVTGMSAEWDVRGEGTSSRRLDIYDALGRLVRTLPRGSTPRDERRTWDLRDGRGMPVPSGVYIFRLSWVGGSAFQKGVVLP